MYQETAFGSNEFQCKKGVFRKHMLAGRASATALEVTGEKKRGEQGPASEWGRWYK